MAKKKTTKKRSGNLHFLIKVNFRPVFRKIPTVNKNIQFLLQNCFDLRPRFSRTVRIWEIAPQRIRLSRTVQIVEMAHRR